MQVYVYIKPNSKHREEVMAGEGGTLVVHTKAPAIDGKANQAARRLLAKHFAVSQTRVELVRGQTSKYKVFAIQKILRS